MATRGIRAVSYTHLDVYKRQDLFSLIRIPSISALPEHHDDMLACAERWAQLLLEAGADRCV